MRNWVQSVLEQYGQAVTIRTASGECSARAFLQPMAEKHEQVPETVTGIGWIDERLWLYLGQEKVSEGDTIVWRDVRFRVRSSRPYYIGETLTHWWASLEREKEAAK